jgi:predicted MFS family arabinose efflux permease
MAIPFLVLYLTKDVGFNAEHAGLMLGLYGLGSLCSSPFLGKLSDRVGPVRVMKVSLFTSTLVMVAYPSRARRRRSSWPRVLLAVSAEAFRPASSPS